MAATTLGFIPLQLIPTSAMGQYSFDKGFPTNGTYVVVKTPTVAQQLQLTKSIKDMQSGKEINNNDPPSKPVILRCKRRVDFTGLGCKLVDSQNPSVSRRNERERKRVKMVNMGFETLRQHVPSGRKNKKMSKVETLRSAVQYIKQLQEMLSGTDSSVSDMLTDNVDMDELENKVTELIQNATNCNINNIDMDSEGATVNDNCSNTNGTLHLQNHQHQQLNQQQLSPQSSPGLPNSPNHLTQEHFFQTYTSANMFSNNFDAATVAYSQASSAGSLHSPTSSIVSDSSYDSTPDNVASNDDDDILSGFTQWF